MSCYSNYRELKAVHLGLLVFAALLVGHHVQVRTDNQLVMSYLNHQGGCRMWSLSCLSRVIFSWAETTLGSLSAIYLPGKENVVADCLNRVFPSMGSMSLTPEAFLMLQERFGSPGVDLFASPDNAKLRCFFTIMLYLGAWKLDAMSSRHLRVCCMCFPRLP